MLVRLAVEKLFKILLGLALLLVPLVPTSPPKSEVPEIEPVEKLLVIKPELVPTNPPNVPYRAAPPLLKVVKMDALAKLFSTTPELVLTKPPVPVVAFEVEMLTPTSRIKPDELLNKPMAPVPVKLPTV